MMAVSNARDLSRLNAVDRPVVSAEEAFEALHVDRSTGYKSIKEGTFPLPVIRIGRVIRIPTAALIQLLEQGQLVSVNKGSQEE